MRLQFVTIGQNLKWPRGRLSLARKKIRREFMTLAFTRITRHLASVSRAKADSPAFLLVLAELKLLRTLKNLRLFSFDRVCMPKKRTAAVFD